MELDSTRFVHMVSRLKHQTAWLKIAVALPGLPLRVLTAQAGTAAADYTGIRRDM
jgi:hypothetical protein